MKLTALAVAFLLCPLLTHAETQAYQQPSWGFWGGSSVTAGTYVFNHDVEVTPLAVVADGEVLENDTGVSIPFGEGEPIEVEAGEDGQVILTPLYNDEERGEMPEKLILSAEEFAAADLTMKSERGHFFPKYLDPRIPMSERRKHKPIGRCAAWVIEHLRVPIHGNGKDITRALLGIGFHEVSCSSHHVGDVASWTGGWHGFGHTAMWNGSCWEYDKGCGDPGHLYHLINCVHR